MCVAGSCWLVWEEGYRGCGVSEAAQSVNGWESSEGPPDVGSEGGEGERVRQQIYRFVQNNFINK